MNRIAGTILTLALCALATAAFAQQENKTPMGKGGKDYGQQQEQQQEQAKAQEDWAQQQQQQAEEQAESQGEGDEQPK